MLDMPKLGRQVLIPITAVMAAIIALTLAADASLGLPGVSVFGPVLDMTMALGGGLVAIAGLHYLDRQLGRNTGEWINELEGIARAIYLAGRLIAVGLLLGLALS